MPEVDYLAELDRYLQQLLLSDREIGKACIPIVARDTLVIRGQHLTIYAISSGMYRHMPLHETVQFDKIFTSDEVLLLGDFEKDELGTTRHVAAALVPYLVKNNFVDANVFLTPGVSAQLGHPLREPVTRLMRVAAQDIFNAEKAKLEGRREMDAPKEIFLSHKGADKPLVRGFKRTLQQLGFSPWIDEESMPAGTELERGIHLGFERSCAAVFFITENFRDENFLASEVNYAMQRKREAGLRFAIVTIVFGGENALILIPKLLRQYVWKQPANHLEALDEIIRALPIVVGAPTWKQQSLESVR